MKKRIVCILVMTLLILCNLTMFESSVADWTPEDGYKMHFPQLPDEYGWDVNASSSVDSPVRVNELADDWVCSETGDVDEIHFWGSWLADNTDFPIVSFKITIYDNIRAGVDGVPYSRPGAVNWTKTFYSWAYDTLDSEGKEGFSDYCCYYPIVAISPDDHYLYFQYNIEDIQDPFHQIKDHIYWLGITAIIDPGITNDHWGWGWKTANKSMYPDHPDVDDIDGHFMDAAVYRCDSGHWHPMWEPYEPTKWLDLAFVINSAPSPPPDPIEIRPGALDNWPPLIPPYRYFFYIPWAFSETLGESHEDVDWSIDISGVFMGKSFEGVIPFIDAEETVSIKTGPIIGFGPIEITVTVEGCDPVKFDGQIFLIFIKLEYP